MPCDLTPYQSILQRPAFLGDLKPGEPVAVAVSGGPDSLALSYLLHKTLPAEHELHILSVDHALRDESARELQDLSEMLKHWQGCTHHILRWEHDDIPASRLQEQARDARYTLMHAYCAGKGITKLFLAHHQDDQAETVLFRLAKGSGLDGLGGMRPVQDYNGLKLLRPFLRTPKQDLIDLCEAQKLPYLSDPSNSNTDFARVRLRESRGALEAEGLTAKRLAQTAKRLSRAREALEQITEKEFTSAILEKNTSQIVFNIKKISELPNEIIFRFIISILEYFDEARDYLPRMEKIEDLAQDLALAARTGADFRKRTLGGVVFTVDRQAGVLRAAKEKP